MDHLRVRTEWNEATVRIALSGELDVSSTSEFRTELDRALSGGPGVILLDVQDLDFIDSSGVHLLVDYHRKAESAGARLQIGPQPEAVARVLAVTGVDKILEQAPREAFRRRFGSPEPA